MESHFSYYKFFHFINIFNKLTIYSILNNSNVLSPLGSNSAFVYADLFIMVCFHLPCNFEL